MKIYKFRWVISNYENRKYLYNESIYFTIEPEYMEPKYTQALK